MERILLCLAHMSGREMDFIEEAFADNWVVPLGPNLPGSDKTLAALSEEQIKKLAAGKHIYPGHLISDIHK